MNAKWTLTKEAFDSLLGALGPDRETAGDRYLAIRRNLVRFFEWRGTATPEEYADETLNRCARKIGEGEQIRDVATYAIGVARMLFRETGRDRMKEPRPLEQAPEPRTLPVEVGADEERRVECLRRCLAQLTAESRDLILYYYQGDKGDKIRNRKGLSDMFGIPANTLRMRALRVRERLHLCTGDCFEGRKANFV